MTKLDWGQFGDYENSIEKCVVLEIEVWFPTPLPWEWNLWEWFSNMWAPHDSNSQFVLFC